MQQKKPTIPGVSLTVEIMHKNKCSDSHLAKPSPSNCSITRLEQGQPVTNMPFGRQIFTPNIFLSIIKTVNVLHGKLKYRAKHRARGKYVN